MAGGRLTPCPSPRFPRPVVRAHPIPTRALACVLAKCAGAAAAGGSLVAVWLTNNWRYWAFVRDTVFPAWRCRYITTWSGRGGRSIGPWAESIGAENLRYISVCGVLQVLAEGDE